MSKVFKVGSLFAGIGGVCLGFQKASIGDSNSYELSWANEINKHACETYRQNFSHTLIEGDITKILEPYTTNNTKERAYYNKMNDLILKDKIDVLTAGFPCQAFSIAGKQKGFKDTRGNLFWDIINLIKQLDKIHGKPRVLFLENVKNLKTHDQGKTYKVIKAELEKLGYIIKEQIINTMHYSSLPQNRERIYILGFLDKTDADNFKMFENLQDFKIEHLPKDRKEEIKKIINYKEKADDKYYYSKEKYPRCFSESLERLEGVETKTGINLTVQIIEYYQFYQIRRCRYVRKNKSNVCPTLTADMGTGGHNVPLIKDYYGIRKITPSEALLLQGFPLGNKYRIPRDINNKPMTDSHLYKQAGNAVSVPIAQLIATELLKTLSLNLSRY